MENMLHSFVTVGLTPAACKDSFLAILSFAVISSETSLWFS
jgi:hypothetical protein